MRLDLLQLRAGLGLQRDVVGPVDLAGDGADLVLEAELDRVQRLEGRGPGLRQLDHAVGEVAGAGRAFCPAVAHASVDAQSSDAGLADSTCVSQLRTRRVSAR